MRIRHSPESAYARGIETRSRLTGIAIRLFGQRGFDGASTRDIAAAASLNTPALQYYFNNKAGLYAACAEHIVSQAWAVMSEVVVGAERLVSGGADDEALIRAFCAVQDRLADLLNGAGGDWPLWMARERAGIGPQSAGMGPKSGTVIGHPKSARMLRVNKAIIGRLLNRSSRDRETLIHETILNGHLTHFYLLRGGSTNELGWREIGAGRLALIKRVARQHAVAALHAIIAARERETLELRGPRRRAPVQLGAA